MRAVRVIMLIAALLVAASLQSSPLASSNWHAKTSSRGLAATAAVRCRSPTQCKSTHYCDGTKCIAKFSGGVACRSWFNCASSQCTKNVCIAQLSTGSKCYFVDQCRSGKCTKNLCVYNSSKTTVSASNTGGKNDKKDN